MINSMIETGNFLQGKNGVQNKSKGNNTGSWNGQTDSFMDILAATKKDTQKPSKEGNAQGSSDKVSSADQQKKESSDSKNEVENNDTVQTEQEKPGQEKPSEESGAADPAMLSIVALLAGNVVVPVVDQETDVPKEAVSSVAAETVLNVEEGSQHGKLAVEKRVQENNLISTTPEKTTAESDIVQEIIAKPITQDVEGQRELPTDNTEKNEALKQVVVKPLSQSAAETQTEQKDISPETISIPAQTVIPNLEQAGTAAIKFNDSSSLLQRQVTQQVTDQIMSHIQDKQQQFTLSLHPERLGQVAVKMLFEGGKVMVQVETHTHLAQHLLSAGATEIKTLLENTGVQVEGVLIEQYMDQKQQNANDSRNQAQHNRHSSDQQNKNGETEAIEDVSAEQIPVSNGLDYSI